MDRISRKHVPKSKASAQDLRLVVDGFAKPREAACFLDIGRDWLYGLVKAGALTHIRHGRRISIPWVVLREYAVLRLKRGRVV